MGLHNNEKTCGQNILRYHIKGFEILNSMTLTRISLGWTGW